MTDPVEPKLPTDIACSLNKYQELTGAKLEYMGKEPFRPEAGIDMRIYQGTDAKGELHTVYASVKAPASFGTTGIGVESTAPQAQKDAVKKAEGGVCAPIAMSKLKLIPMG